MYACIILFILYRVYPPYRPLPAQVRPFLTRVMAVLFLVVEYAERRIQHVILFICSLFDEYVPLAHVRAPVIYRVHQADYVIRFLMAIS